MNPRARRPLVWVLAAVAAGAALGPGAQAPSEPQAAAVVRAGVDSSRAAPARLTLVQVVDDDRVVAVRVPDGATAGQVLIAAGVHLGEHDTVVPEPGEPAGGQVTVTRAQVSVVTETETVPAPVRQVPDPHLPAGSEQVRVAGVDGRLSRVVQVHTLPDGTVTGRVVLAELEVAAVEHVVAVGTRRAAPVRAAAPVEPGTARALAQQMVADRGWDATQFACLDALWAAESGWRVDAHNARSGAHGIPQALPGSKMASAGADWATNPVTQITWGLGYVAARYGSPCGAWEHHQARGWY